MALEDDISGLMNKCSLTKEEEEEVINKEQTEEDTRCGSQSLVGRLAAIQTFHKAGLKNVMLRAWNVKEENAKFIEISANLYQIVFTRQAFENFRWIVVPGSSMNTFSLLLNGAMTSTFRPLRLTSARNVSNCMVFPLTAKERAQSGR
ncbi:hypothetical protein Sjap_005175 [Stephania japonica]|uniref:Uncharacterized protein n=1 Tax=Stephania japonica TaxID=461633 RepID=A0AAP0K3K9_9MAGN